MSPAGLYDGTKGLEDIGEIYRRMTVNCPHPASKSKRLWELRLATYIKSSSPYAETMLEKAVALLAEGGHMRGWFNQCPTASGIGGSSRDRGSRVDLVHWSVPAMQARLVELKWRSSRPSEAVRQALRYGAAYVFCRMHRHRLPLRDASLMDARHVSIEVVAPPRYWRAPDLQGRIARARESLKRFDVGSRIAGLSMSLDVLAFPDWFDQVPFADGAGVLASCSGAELTGPGRMVRDAFGELSSVAPDGEGSRE